MCVSQCQIWRKALKGDAVATNLELPWIMFITCWTSILHAYKYCIMKSCNYGAYRSPKSLLKISIMVLMGILFIFTFSMDFYSLFIHSMYILLTNVSIYTYNMLCYIVVTGSWVTMFWLRQVAVLSPNWILSISSFILKSRKSICILISGM